MARRKEEEEEEEEGEEEQVEVGGRGFRIFLSLQDELPQECAGLDAGTVALFSDPHISDEYPAEAKDWGRWDDDRDAPPRSAWPRSYALVPPPSVACASSPRPPHASGARARPWPRVPPPSLGPFKPWRWHTHRSCLRKQNDINIISRRLLALSSRGPIRCGTRRQLRALSSAQASHFRGPLAFVATEMSHRGWRKNQNSCSFSAHPYLRISSPLPYFPI